MKGARAKRFLPAVIVIAAIAAAYGGLLASPDLQFVSGDARYEGASASTAEPGDYLHSLRECMADSGHWSVLRRPLRSLDLALDFTLFGASPLWFHLRNILYHIIGSLLVLELLRKWGAGEPAAILGTLVFALHPVQVESVAWITSRGDLLCLVFFLAALLLHGRGGRWGWVGAATALVLALLSKEVAVVFPAAALLSDFFFRDERKLKTTLGRWPQYLVYAVLVGVYITLWIHWQGEDSESLSKHLGGSFVGSFLTMSRGFVYYLRLIFVPADMAQDFHALPVWGPDPVTLACVAIQLGTIFVAFVCALRGRDLVPFAVLWFFVLLLPASNLLVSIGIPTAERFLYLPMVGVVLPVGVVLALVWQTTRLGRATVAVLLLCLLAVSADRALTWATEDRLWDATLARGDGPDGLERRALALMERAEATEDSTEVHRILDEALRIHDRRIRYWTKLPVPTEQMVLLRTNRLSVLIGLGRFDTARFEEVLQEAEAIHQLRPDLPDARTVAAHALFWLDRRFEARQIMDEVLSATQEPRILKSAARLFHQLGETYRQDGNRALARRYLHRSLEVGGGPDANPEAHRLLLELDGECAARLIPLERKRSRSPGDQTVLLELAELNARYGHFREAMRIYRDLLRAQDRPRDPALLFSLGRWYWEPQDTPEGFRTALALYWEIEAESPEWDPVRVKARRLVCESR